jgi:epoxyqueuosine reductase
MVINKFIDKRSEEIRAFFNNQLQLQGEQGDIGFVRFKTVFDSLMPIQQEKLKSITAELFESLLREGSFISFGVAYKIPEIEVIDSRIGDQINYEMWNRYAREYNRLNQILNKIAKDIAIRFEGIPLKATIDGVIGKINHVSEYFGLVISHRAVAELAGVGWRGKNQLVIHEKFSCAIRFASVIVPYTLDWGNRIESKCGSCSACEDACTFIKNRNKLPDYRENCRRYILFLMSMGIEKDICGKCIKACYKNSIYRDEFILPS